MNRYYSTISRFGILLMSMLVFSGCATSDLVLKPVYQPVGDGRGPGGELVLIMSVEGPSRPGSDAVSSVYGEVRNSDGKVKGNIISSISPSAFIREALRQELQKAGYDVKFESEMPKTVKNGLVVTKSEISLDETTSIVKMEGTCKISVAVDLWKEGAMIRKLTYEKVVSDYAVRDREKLHNQLLQKTLAAVMKDAQADIVKYLVQN